MDSAIPQTRTRARQKTGDHGYVDSYYAATRAGDIGAPALAGRESADVCVVGGGLTGCSAALHLARRGYSVCLLEAERIGWGCSGRSGGQIGPGLSTDMTLIERQLDRHGARAIWDMTRESVELVSGLVREYEIPCDLRWGLVHAAVKPRQMDALKRECDQLARDYDYTALTLLDRAGIRERVASDTYVGGACQRDAGHLHPLNYTLGLARAAQATGARLFEHSRVSGIDYGRRHRVRTPAGEIDADYVLLCGGAYLGRMEPRIAAKIMPVGTYIIATEPLEPSRAQAILPGDDAVVDLNFVLDYYRLSADRRMLFGGKVSYSTRQPRNLPDVMGRRMRHVFPQLAGARIDYAWGGFVGITISRAPHFGRVNPTTFFAHGFSGHGMALTSLAGKLMAEAIAGQAERFDLFARIPHRSFPGGAALRTPLLVLATTYYRLRDLL